MFEFLRCAGDPLTCPTSPREPDQHDDARDGPARPYRSDVHGTRCREKPGRYPPKVLRGGWRGEFPRTRDARPLQGVKKSQMKVARLSFLTTALPLPAPVQVDVRCARAHQRTPVLRPGGCASDQTPGGISPRTMLRAPTTEPSPMVVPLATNTPCPSQTGCRCGCRAPGSAAGRWRHPGCCACRTRTSSTWPENMQSSPITIVPPRAARSWCRWWWVVFAADRQWAPRA
jgi:hypothetical protein